MSMQAAVRSVYPKLTPYVSGLADYPAEQIKEILGIERVYKLSFNENSLGPSQKATEAMGKALQSLNLYPSSRGEMLQEAIAVKEGVTAGNVLLANGADELINLAAMTFLEAGDEVIIPAVTFVQYEAAANIMGAVPVSAPMDDSLGIDLDSVLEVVTDRTKMICLCNPNNPTGASIADRDVEAFLRRVPPHIIVVIDEAYYEYAVSPAFSSAVKYISEYENLLTVRTFSKIYSLAAARIGYGIGSEALIEAIHHVRPPFNVNAIAQAGALAGLKDAEHLLASKRMNEEGKAMLYKAFRQWEFSYIESDGNFVYVDTGMDAKEVFNQLAREGIIVRTLGGYGLPQSLRVSVGTAEELRAFTMALDRLLQEK